MRVYPDSHGLLTPRRRYPDLSSFIYAELVSKVYLIALQ